MTDHQSKVAASGINNNTSAINSTASGGNTQMSSEREVDQLVYRGNAVPRFLRVAWTLFIVFAFFYLFMEKDEISNTDFVKDLGAWINKSKN